MPVISWRVLTLAGAIAVVSTAFGAAATTATGDGLSVEVFASGGASFSKADDITAMNGSVFVSWQNGVGPQGEPAANGNTQSSVVQYSLDGGVLNSWQLTGRCDGLSADRQNNRLIATVNEDGNSSLYVIFPSAAPGAQLVHYAYSPNPPVHGGGTDAAHIYRGQIFLTASNPSDSTQPAVYRASLSGGVATLSPVFFDNSTAIVANTNDPARGSAVGLSLSDPDSNSVVPGSSPRFGGDFMQDSQGDGLEVFAQDAGTAAQQLFVLTLSGAGASTAVDDTVWATAARGTIYATDGKSTVYAVTGFFTVGTAYSTVSPGNANTPSSQPNYLATLDLNTGLLTPVSGVTFTPKGLVFVAGAHGDGN